jgi:hypothetical protein
MPWDVDGRGLRPGTFADQLGHPDGDLVVFLRHAGCCFCGEMIADVQAAAGAPGFPFPLFVHQGDRTQGNELLSGHPEARAIADPRRRLYSAFGVERGSAVEMFGPAVWRCGARALGKGHGIGPRVGDGWTLPTLVLVRDGRIAWEHRGRHAGDHPNLTELLPEARTPA